MTVRYYWILSVWLVLDSLRFNQARHASHVERTDDLYFHLDSESDTYHYGYEVTPDGNFHHERRGPEGVTYGCYGYFDSIQKLHVTHYVADRKGYRVVEPNKPMPIYLSEQIICQAFLLPKGCGSHTGKPSSTGPELIYKPLGAVSTPSKPATTTTKRTTTTSAAPTKPSVIQPVTCASATFSCVWPTSTKPKVLTPKPPTKTTIRSVNSTTTARTTSFSTTTPSTTTTPKTTQSTKKPDRSIVEIDVDITIVRPSHYIYRPSNTTLNEEHLNLEFDSRAQSPTSPLIYYVPYQQNSAPPGVPSISHGTCGSGFGYIGLAPVIFVPIASAKNLGLVRNDSEFGSSGIPLRMFTKPVEGGNWTITEMIDDDGNHFGLSYSEELKKIVNDVDLGLLMRGDSFK